MDPTSRADLSECHEPVGALFSVPKARSGWQAFRLDEQQVEFYQENGYLAGGF